MKVEFECSAGQKSAHYKLHVVNPCAKVFFLQNSTVCSSIEAISWKFTEKKLSLYVFLSSSDI